MLFLKTFMFMIASQSYEIAECILRNLKGPVSVVLRAKNKPLRGRRNTISCTMIWVFSVVVTYIQVLT